MGFRLRTGCGLPELGEQEAAVAGSCVDDGGEGDAHGGVGEQGGEEVAVDQAVVLVEAERPECGAMGGRVIMPTSTKATENSSGPHQGMRPNRME
ncbi:hypothetical protein BAY60_18560 [Prauserella muralis]|uniref:Uncharacterized protein n=1 Tax=Prauserella muralis TaxID=588067 RepID=A0A2V4AVA2_9PSEU|nr:hypothetical protein BAY60_18560 [Prauserella muralis]